MGSFTVSNVCSVVLEEVTGSLLDLPCDGDVWKNNRFVSIFAIFCTTAVINWWFYQALRFRALIGSELKTQTPPIQHPPGSLILKTGRQNLLL